MKSVKGRWDTEYPASRRTAQTLIDNARRFKKGGWGRPAELENRDEAEVQQQTQVIREQQRKSIEWTTEMKIVLVFLFFLRTLFQFGWTIAPIQNSGQFIRKHSAF